MVEAAISDASDVLSVDIDRTHGQSIEAPSTVTVTDDFTIDVTNEGEPIHLHLSCDDDLAPALGLETGNHFIHREGTYQIPVEVLDGERPLRGRFRLSVGYGAETAYVEVRVVEPRPEDQVRVDESLAEPRGGVEPPAEDVSTGLEPLTIATIGVAIAAVVGGIVLVGVYTEPVLGVVLAAAVLALATGAYVLGDLG